MGRLCVVLVLALLGAAGCSDDCDSNEACGSRALPPVAPTPVPTPTPAPLHRIEFRVLGDYSGAVAIRYSTSQAGTTTVVSSLPWVQTLALAQATSFLTLSAALPADAVLFTPVRLHVQIVVDGRIFREADVVSFTPTASVAGQYDEAAVPLGVQ